MTTQGQLISGIWYTKEDMAKGLHLRNNNPKGNNRYTPKEELKKPEPKHIFTVEEVKELYQKLRLAYREYLSATQRHSEAHYQLMGYRAKVEVKEDNEML